MSNTSKAVTVRDKVNKKTYQFSSKKEALDAGFNIVKELNFLQQQLSVHNTNYHAYFKGYSTAKSSWVGKKQRRTYKTKAVEVSNESFTKRYQSIDIAASDLGINPQMLAKVARGEMYKTKGYAAKYVD